MNGDLFSPAGIDEELPPEFPMSPPPFVSLHFESEIFKWQFEYL